MQFGIDGAQTKTKHDLVSGSTAVRRQAGKCNCDMTEKNRQSLRIDAEFTEDTVAVAIELFLTLVSFPRLLFTIQLFSRAKERWLGADARLEGRKIRSFRPFYMQFKRPSAYPDTSRSSIVKERKALRMSIEPRSLFFSLLPKRSYHHDFQHNILHRLHRRLRRRNLGDAAYVCPLFLDRSAYSYHLHWAGLRMWSPFRRRPPWHLRYVRVHQRHSVIDFESIPVLAEHVSIPPHELVQTYRHRYSFDEAGKDLCFHSPMALPEGAMTLGVFLNLIEQEFLADEGQITPDTAFQSLLYLSGAADPEETILFDKSALNPEDPIGSWLFWGDFLRREYNIEQFAFINWNDA